MQPQAPTAKMDPIAYRVTLRAADAKKLRAPLTLLQKRTARMAPQSAARTRGRDRLQRVLVVRKKSVRVQIPADFRIARPLTDRFIGRFLGTLTWRDRLGSRGMS
jgi:hypothetical protein